jgi:hypothetical protein
MSSVAGPDFVALEMRDLLKGSVMILGERTRRGAGRVAVSLEAAGRPEAETGEIGHGRRSVGPARLARG